MNEIGLFDVNFDTGKCYWSFELMRMLGVRRDVPAEFHLLLQCIHPDDRRAFGRRAMQPFRTDCPRHSSIDKACDAAFSNRLPEALIDRLPRRPRRWPCALVA